MEFPRSVFRSPGKHDAGHGNTFDYSIVDDEEEFKGALAAGFWESVPEAIENPGSVDKFLATETEDAPKPRRGRPPKE